MSVCRTVEAAQSKEERSGTKELEKVTLEVAAGYAEELSGGHVVYDLLESTPLQMLVLRIYYRRNAVDNRQGLHRSTVSAPGSSCNACLEL